MDRADRVIKRSGVRISFVELSEAMRGLAGVTAAACITFDDDGQLGIVAFVVSDALVTASELSNVARDVSPNRCFRIALKWLRNCLLLESSKLDERRLLSQAGLRTLSTRTALGRAVKSV